MRLSATKWRAIRRLRFARSDGGAALVEFAIVLPLLLTIVFGIVDFARAFYTQNNLTSAVREGARWASVQNAPTVAGVQTIVKGFANNVGNTAAKFGGPPVTDPEITVTFTPAMPATRFITVAVNNYPFAWITPLPGLVGFGQTNLNAQAVFRWERAPGP